MAYDFSAIALLEDSRVRSLLTRARMKLHEQEIRALSGFQIDFASRDESASKR
jgi:hypothetical protein